MRFYRNTQECSGEGLGEKPLNVTVRDFLEVRYAERRPSGYRNLLPA